MEWQELFKLDIFVTDSVVAGVLFVSREEEQWDGRHSTQLTKVSIENVFISSAAQDSSNW